VSFAGSQFDWWAVVSAWVVVLSLPLKLPWEKQELAPFPSGMW
jgi:hypothetical protein